MGEGTILRGEMKGVFIKHKPKRVENNSRGVEGFPLWFYIFGERIYNIVLQFIQQCK